MWLSGGIDRAAAGSRPRASSVRYRPLGSPTAASNWSYVHVPRVPEPVAGCMHELGSWGRCTRGGAAGWVYRVWYYPSPPGIPVLVLPGPNRWPSSALSASTRHSRALQALPHTWLLALSIPPRTSIRRDSILYILKLVETAECR